MSESSNLSSNSSFDSISDFGDKMADDPLINLLTSGQPGINTGSGMPGINTGYGLSSVNVNSNSATILTHPGYKNLMDAFNYLRTLLTPIEYAFYLYGINDYLRNVVMRKQNRLRKRVFSETLTSDAASVASLRIQALQEQYYSSFYGRTTAVNALSSNSVANPSFHASQNSFLIPQRNEIEDTFSTILPNGSQYDKLPYRNGILENCNDSQRFPAPLQSSAFAGQSSSFQKTRNQASVSQINQMNLVNPRNGSHIQNQNSFGNQQKFSEMEDTFRSGKSVNGMLFENSRNLSRRLMKPGPLHSSFMGKSRNNVSSFQVNSSILSGSYSRQNNSSALPIGEIEEDQFSCVRVGPLSEKFLLPPVQEVEEESASLSSISLSEEEGSAQNTNNNDKPKDQKDYSTNKSTVQTNSSKNFKPNVPKNSLDNDKSIIQTNSSSNEFVLTNWTVVLINKKLHLKGIKLINNKIVEKNHLSREILYRSRQGIIRTNGDYFYTLEPPFVDNEDMPEKIKHVFRSKKFPLTWRCMLSNWIQEKDRKSDLDTKLKSCQVLLRRKMSEKNNIEDKKVNGSQEKEDESPKNSRPTKKPLGKTNGTGRKRTKKPASSGIAKKKSKQEKNRNISEENGESEARSSSQETNSKRAGNKNNKKQTSSGTTKKKLEPVKSKNISEDLNGDIASSSSSEESSNQAKNKKKINKNLQNHVNGGGTSGKTSKRNKNCFEDFEESILNSSSRDKNSYTPNALLRSITKSSALPIGRHTPPLKLIGEMLKKNNVKSRANDTSSEICPENYLVAKRIRKTKGSKKVRNNKKEESSADGEVQNLLMALTNKTPQTTPKAIREVFRNEEESRNSNSDFGSDISSI